MRFDEFRLKLGPDFRISSQPLANFNAEGLLTLNSSLEKKLGVKGVVRLMNGSINLFTTTFNLDRKYKNTATFTPSMGLVPFLDIKLITRVPDVVNDTYQLTSPNDFVMRKLYL